MKKLTLAEYNAIHRDFRGVWSREDGDPTLVGRKTVLSGAIGLAIGHLAIEGIDFEIVKPDKLADEQFDRALWN